MDDRRKRTKDDGRNKRVPRPSSFRPSILRLTDAGKTVLHGTCFVALAALIVPAFGVLSALVSVLLMSLLVGYVLRPRIQVSGNLPDRVVAGQTAKLRYVLKNVARLPAYNFSVRLDALPDAIEQIGGEHIVPRLGPGETTKGLLPVGSSAEKVTTA